MPNPPRRVPPPTVNPHQYYAVPQSPRSASHARSAVSAATSPPRSSASGPPRSSASGPSRYESRYPATPARTPSGGRSQASVPRHPTPQRDVTRGVATAIIGNAYGPYSYEPQMARDAAAYSQARQAHRPGAYPPPRTYSQANTQVSASYTDKPQSSPPTPAVNTSTVPIFMWDTKDPDLDDPLHNPDPIRDAALDRSWTLWSSRGWANAIMLFVLLFGLIILFAGYPIIIYAQKEAQKQAGFNIGGINGSGQIPSLPGLPTLVDADTPSEFLTRIGTDGKKYNLVFSDEFEVDGRTFWPGDDPFWEAVDLNYWPTGDIEWYDPQAVTTENGKLVITMDMIRNHDLNFRSGMLQSWNKFCFTTGYIEMSVSMPGSPQAPGLWPAAWTMGNLGRAGYGATTEGLWPYTYDSCDIGTFLHQVDKNGSPATALNGGPGGSNISSLPGQRLSACTCPGSDHPGPTVDTGRGAPEIDIFETQIDVSVFRGEVSQSLQAAPFNYHYDFTSNSTPATTIYDTTLTKLNPYKGGPYQQAISAVTYIDNQNYDGMGYQTYAFEWWSNPNHRDEGYVTWFSNGQKVWTATTATVGPDPQMKIGQRLISEEPHYIIMNLGMAPNFQRQDFKNMKFPAKMYVDYVRVYQREDVSGVGCDPKSHPTAKYINKHMNAYTNPNLTTWAQANNTFPRNSLYDGCY